MGYHSGAILARRRINDSMGTHVAERVIRLMLSKRIHVVDAKILILVYAFKENCPDSRNIQVAAIVSTLHSYHTHVDVYDPRIDQNDSPHVIQKLGNGS